MILKKPAMEAYKEGVANGTISPSMQEVIDTVIEQEVVSYCSTKGTYTSTIWTLTIDMGVCIDECMPKYRVFRRERL